MGNSRSTNTTLDAWTDICHSLLFGKRLRQAPVHPIHTCVIRGKRFCFHAPDLEWEDKGYFRRLKAFAEKHSIELSKDRRSLEQEPDQRRRKKLLPIIFLALGAHAPAVFADAPEQKSSLHLMSSGSPLLKLNPHPWHEYEHEAFHLEVNPEVSRSIACILRAHYQVQHDDPGTIDHDLKQLADYYSGHREAVKLINSVANADWTLKYAPHTFQTDISGTRMRVNKVDVYFDPRSAAQLKFYDKCSDKKPFCIASPADALLHELLHVQTIFTDSTKFIRQGGLNNHIYPAAHEQRTILKENILYKTMSIRDKKPRPIRSEHSGRHVLVSCVTCVD